ncbi:SEC-C metal-binding domain-containing protein [Streptomyces sp. NPDC088921]|uniref:SEC-C metal-binding domain-containing protein n=1 Tax=unclassified Streptomyces TaxID=2593676 RepID=UPI0034267B75
MVSVCAWQSSVRRTRATPTATSSSVTSRPAPTRRRSGAASVSERRSAPCVSGAEGSSPTSAGRRPPRTTRPIGGLNRLSYAGGSDQPPQRSDPCPCGSGRKYKRCVHLWGQPSKPAPTSRAEP